MIQITVLVMKDAAVPGVTAHCVFMCSVACVSALCGI